MFSNDTDTTTITPNVAIPDDEERYILCVVEALKSAQEYVSAVYSARSDRGAATLAVETDRDTLLDLERGYGRALEIRRRDLRAFAGELVQPCTARGRR